MKLHQKKYLDPLKDLKLLTEWERFHSSLTLVKEKRNWKVLFKILKYPNNLNKLKLLIIFFFPDFVSRRIVGET